MGGLAALFFLFHTGQAVRLKSRLVNAADAVALSAGHLQARALNVTALHNRALLANEVMLAQMVGISSWTAHAQTHLAQLPWVHPECADAQGTGAGTGALFKYGPSYALMCYLASQGAEMVVGSGLSSLPAQATFWAAQTERYKLAIQQAQRQVFDGSKWQVQQQAWMQAVAHANLPGFPELDVEAVDAAQGWDNFTQWRAGEGRRPLADMARQALAQDPFSQDRRWTARALLPTPECFPALEFDRFNEVRRRGSTELVGLDEWRAVDTQSFHAWRLHKGKGLLPRCEPEETPTSWGSQAATGPGADNNGETSLTFGESRTDNPQAHALASTNAWSFYSGLPIYRSLSDRALAAKDARLPLTVRLALSAPNLGSGAGSAGVVNAYKPAWAGGQMVALSSVEVYFERPFDDPHNAWGQTVGTPVELPSLFNPFWHARLIDVPSTRTEQQLRQGAQTP
jgi:Flp pilus assembly protein TadG